MGTKQEQDKHRHHKQPQFFLKGFAFVNSGYQKKPDIWVYKKKHPYKDGINPSLESVKDTGYGRDFYAFTKEDGTEDFNTYENRLMREFEQPAQPILGKIIRLEEINEKEKEIFSKFIASMITRGDWGKDKSKVAMELAIKAQLSANPNLPESVLKIFDDEISKLKSNGEIYREQIISKADLIAGYVKDMVWNFWISPKIVNYLTSDNPVSYSQLRHEEGYLIFPICSNICLYATWHGSKDKMFKEVTTKIVEEVRDRIVTIAIKEVYFSRKSEWLVKFINNRNN